MRASISRRHVLTGSAAFASIEILPRAARAADFHYKLGHNSPDGQSHTVRTKQLAAEVARETNGRFVIELFPNSVLGSDAAMLSQVRSGALEMELTAGTYIAAFAPTAEMDSIPFAYASSDQALRAFDGEFGRYLRTEMISKGFMPLAGTWDTGFRHVSSSVKPIVSPDDINGLKIRTPPSRLWIDTFKALGASPTPLAISALYVSLQTKVVDGVELPLDFIEFGRYYEVQKYLSLTGHMWGTRWLVMNVDAWNALPKDFQAILQRASAKYAALAHRDTAALNPSLVDKLRRRGMSVNAVDRLAFRHRLGSAFYQRWKEQFGSTAWALLERATGRLA